MAAGLGFKDFTTGEVLTAADVDGYLMQGVWVFASAAARDAAVTSPQEGNFAYLKDTNVTTYYTGSAWANLDTTGMTNPMTTTGDTIYSSSGSTPARLGVGSTGQVLTVAGGVPTWATPASGGGMTLLSTTTTNGTSSYTLSSIDQSYKRLIMVGVNISKTATASVRIYPQDGTTDLDLRYRWTSGGNSYDNSSSYAIWPDNNNGYIATNAPLNFTWTIDNYASTSQHKPMNMYGAYYRTDTSTLGFNIWGASYSNNAINKITISSDYNFNGGTIYLYGVN